MKFKFEELQVYQKALDVIDEVYQVSKNFPNEETYGLTSQFRRATVSIALNIVKVPGELKKNFYDFSVYLLIL